jgi:hypothetical protein
MRILPKTQGEARSKALARIQLAPTIKRCACGRSFDREAWENLPSCGVQDDDEERLQIRHSPCGSTIAVVIGPSPTQAPPIRARFIVLLAEMDRLHNDQLRAFVHKHLPRMADRLEFDVATVGMSHRELAEVGARAIVMAELAR